MGARNVIVTGGDLEKAIDLLSLTTERGIEQEVFKGERHQSASTHGPARLRDGACVPSGARPWTSRGRALAKAYVSAAIANAYPLGHGTGPLHHLYRMHEQRRNKVVAEKEHA